jgi:hypothetical protein
MRLDWWSSAGWVEIQELVPMGGGGDGSLGWRPWLLLQKSPEVLTTGSVETRLSVAY